MFGFEVFSFSVLDKRLFLFYTSETNFKGNVIMIVGVLLLRITSC